MRNWGYVRQLIGASAIGMALLLPMGVARGQDPKPPTPPGDTSTPPNPPPPPPPQPKNPLKGVLEPTSGSDSSNYAAWHQERVRFVIDTAQKVDAFCRENMTGQSQCIDSKNVLCVSICVNLTYSNKRIDYRKLKDPVLANAAVAADYTTVQLLFRNILKADSSAPQAGLLLNLEKSEEALGGGPKIASVSPVLTTEFAAVAIQGLAKLLQDRAKWEAASWFLDRMGKDICLEKTPKKKKPGPSTTPKPSEEAMRWFPSLCTLSQDEHLWRYGAGGQMGDTLRAALAADLNQWPGRYLAIVLARALQSSGERFDNSVVRLVERLRKGENAFLALSEFSITAESINRPTDPKKTVVKSNRLGVFACAASLPAFFQAHESAFVTPDRHSKNRSLILAGLASTPACWSIVGQGFTRPCLQSEATSGCVNPTGALATGLDLEKLTTILRWADQLGPSVSALGSDWNRLQVAINTYQELISNPPPPVKPSLQLPPIQLNGSEDSAHAVAAAATQVEWLQRQSEYAAQKRVLRAGLEVFDASLALVYDTLECMNVLNVTVPPGGTNPDPLFPGLKLESNAAQANSLPESIGGAQVSLTDMRNGIKLIEAAIDENWAELGRLMTIDLGRMIIDNELRKTIEKYLGFVVAVLSAKSSDDMAAAFDQVINPPGGWHTKAQQGAKTWSITSQVGMFGALEVRHGQYGAKWEDYTPSFQAPTLAMPTGIEYAVGSNNQSSALFFSILDPASFLQYDVDENGRLPSARLLTAFSPGIGYRAGIKDSPFSVMPLAVYRPGFRAWDKSFLENGADAFQFGVMFSVDVTLFSLSHSEGSL